MTQEVFLKAVPKAEPSIAARLKNLEEEASALGLEISRELSRSFAEAATLASAVKNLSSVPVGVRQEAKVLLTALEGSRKRIEAILERD